MTLIERYLLRQFTASVAAVAIVLLLVSLGFLFIDVVGEIARGKVPASLLLSQLGLRTLRYLPILLPLALFVGVLLAVGRLYADSEMAVLASVGIGPQRLLKPLLRLTLPVVATVAFAALWLSPWSMEKAREMIDIANRSLLVAGLEAGRFVELPGHTGILYVGELSPDGTRFHQMFSERRRGDRYDIITARTGDVVYESEADRVLRLQDGYRLEGTQGARDYRMMHFQTNDVRLPEQENDSSDNGMATHSTWSLIQDGTRAAKAELHWRLAMPLLAVALALLAVPLGRSEPRQPRYGGFLVAMLVYVISIGLIFIGYSKLANGPLPTWSGLWWLHLPLFALAWGLFRRDGRLRSRKVGPA